MKKLKKIPYGISNFRSLRLQDYLYVDKTKYIEILESYGEKYIFFLRPRRFGKSLFVSLLSSYYDVNAREEFSKLFARLYIGANPTPLANSYYILHFNFSGINTSEREIMLQSFTRVVLSGLNEFIKRYNLDIAFPFDDQPADVLNYFLTEVSHQIPGKIYVLIDEYDHFANELLSFQVELFEETISKTGFVRKWFEVLKIGTEKGIIDRLFVTGVSPVTLDGLTSGFNIASNLTRDENLNEMLGFTESEVIDLLQEILPEEAATEKLLPDLRKYYNGYLFSERASKRVFNSDMILYYLNSYQKSGEPPLDLIDTNISSDYAKLQKLFTLKSKERNYRILERILNNEPQLTTITREFSLAKEFTEEDFLSLLFYLGFLTVDKLCLDMVYLKVPNYAIRELYFNFFAQILKEKSSYDIETIQIRKSIIELASVGKIESLEQVKEVSIMSIKLYYFSGTGNSFIVAKEIAQNVNADLLSIPKVMEMDKIQIDAESIGIIFPSYLALLSGLPLMVEQFVKKIANIESVHIFAVCTCGGYESVNALPSLHRLKQIIKACGGKLAAEYSVRLPMNNLDYDHIPIPIVRDEEVIITRSKTKIADICERIIKKKGTKHKIAKTTFYLLMTPLFKLMQQPVTNHLKERAKEPADTQLKYFELIPLTDKSIVVDDKCTGCGTCAKVCPAKNIKIVEKKPEFQHRCEMCFACDEWCPSRAVHHWSRAEGVKYHHPEAKIADMF